MVEPVTVVGGLLTLAGGAAVTRAAAMAVEEATAKVRKRREMEVADREAKEALIGAWDQHLLEVHNWARQFKPPGNPTPLETAKASLALLHTREPKYSRGSGRRPEALSERELLAPENHTLLLGGAGAGKTTTVRRLVLHLLGASEDSPTTGYAPLLVLAREYDWNRVSLPRLLCAKLGQNAESGRELNVVAAILNGYSARA